MVVHLFLLQEMEKSIKFKRGFKRIHIPLPIGSITFRVHIASLESNTIPFGLKAKLQDLKIV